MDWFPYDNDLRPERVKMLLVCYCDTRKQSSGEFFLNKVTDQNTKTMCSLRILSEDCSEY